MDRTLKSYFGIAGYFCLAVLFHKLQGNFGGFNLGHSLSILCLIGALGLFSTVSIVDGWFRQDKPSIMDEHWYGVSMILFFIGFIFFGMIIGEWLGL